MLKPTVMADIAPPLSGLAFGVAHSHWAKPSRLHTRDQLALSLTRRADRTAQLRDGKRPAQAAQLTRGRARAPDLGSWSIEGKLEGVLVRGEGKGQCRGEGSKNEV